MTQPPWEMTLDFAALAAAAAGTLLFAWKDRAARNTQRLAGEPVSRGTGITRSAGAVHTRRRRRGPRITSER